MAYSMEVRRAVARRYDECGSSDQVAEEMGCSGSWVRRLIQRRELTGSLEPLAPKLPDNRVLADADLGRLRDLIADRPDLTRRNWRRSWGTRRASRPSGGRRGGWA